MENTMRGNTFSLNKYENVSTIIKLIVSVWNIVLKTIETIHKIKQQKSNRDSAKS